MAVSFLPETENTANDSDWKHIEPTILTILGDTRASTPCLRLTMWVLGIGTGLAEEPNVECVAAVTCLSVSTLGWVSEGSGTCEAIPGTTWAV